MSTTKGKRLVKEEQVCNQDLLFLCNEYLRERCHRINNPAMGVEMLDLVGNLCETYQIKEIDYAALGVALKKNHIKWREYQDETGLKVMVGICYRV